MATLTLDRGVNYGWYGIDEAASEYFWEIFGKIPEDFHDIVKEEMKKLMPEGLLWMPDISEIWTGNGENGDVEVSDEDWGNFDFDEAVDKAFDSAVEYYNDAPSMTRERKIARDLRDKNVLDLDLDLCEEFCKLACMSNEWEEVGLFDCKTVLHAAAEKLGVEI